MSPRIIYSVEKRPQPRYYRVYVVRCETCGEECHTPAHWGGSTRAEILSSHRYWARGHRKEHLPGGRKATARFAPKPI